MKCRQINEVVIAVAWGGQYHSFGGKSVFLSFLTSYLNFGYLLYVCTHSYNVYSSVIAECIFINISFFSAYFLNGSLEHMNLDTVAYVS